MHISIQNFGFNDSVKCFIADGFYEFPTRIHQFTEIQYIINGTLELTVDGITEHLSKGDIAVISPFRNHSFKCSHDAKRWILIPSNNFIADYISNESVLINGEKCSFSASNGLKSYLDENLFDMGDKIFDLGLNKRLMLKIKALSYAILEEYTRTIPQRKTNLKNNALANIVIYLSEHFKENLTRESVGAKLGYSSSYISHVIETIPNMTFSKLLNSLRVEYAKNLLLGTELSMIDIALDSGFGSERSFYRIFKESTGYTPFAYKKAKHSQL